jgi:hypothetical protein
MAAARCRITGAASRPGAGAEEAAAEEHLLNNVFFDTCVYHQPGIDLLTKVIPVEEHPVRQRDDRRGARHRSRDRQYYDDTKRYIEASTILSRRGQAAGLRGQCAARLSAPRPSA